jgi:hypothetical protein
VTKEEEEEVLGGRGPVEKEEVRFGSSSALACPCPYQDQASADQCSQVEMHHHLA